MEIIIKEMSRKGSEMRYDMDLNKENIRKIRGLIVFTIVVLVGLWNYKVLLEVCGFIGKMILPFVVGGTIAFVLNVPMHFIEEKLFGSKKMKSHKWVQKMARPVSLFLTIVFVVGLIVLVMFVVAPALANTVMNLGKTVQEFVPQVQMWVERVCKDKPEIRAWIDHIDFQWEELLKNGMDFLKNGSGNLFDSTFEKVKNIVNGMSTFFIGLAFSCYFLLQKEKLSVQAKKVMYAFWPKDWTEIFIALGSLTYKTFSNFLTGQCVEAIILGMMFFVAMTILKFPYALLIGVLIAFTALIPVFGAFIGCVVGMLLIFMENPPQVVGFLVLFFVLQQIEGNLIYPHVVGNSVGLPSIWVLVAVSIGARLMGVVGMLIFIPISSIVYTLLKGIVHRRLREKKIEVRG